MPIDQQIQAQLQALQGQFDISSDTLKRLREKYATETDVPEQVKLERQIKETESALEKLSHELDVLERAPDRGRPVGQAVAIPIPRLLPYLSDRSTQEMKLGQALNFLQENKPRRPFICIVHGDEHEAHEMYQERLLKVTLPKLLHFDAVRDFFKEYTMKWPANSVAKQMPNSLMQSCLASAVVGNSAASLQEMVAEILRQEMPVMVHTHLLTEDWELAAQDLTKEFFVLWNRWPDHAHDRLLIICMFLKYQSPDKQGFLQKRKLKTQNEAIRRFLAELDFSKFDQLHGVVLPELCAISRREVEDWVTEHAREFCHIDALLPKIRALYARKELSTPEGGITMEKLAGELRKLLHEHRC